MDSRVRKLCITQGFTQGVKGLTNSTTVKCCSTAVVKGDEGGQMKASDWSKNYANHLVTSLIDRSDQKWSNQNGESPFMECDWLTVMRYDGQV